jgi:GNAT superfamily N-acetyltransferase
MATFAESETAVFSRIDSERFGVRVARAHIGPENLQRVLAFCWSERIDVLIARCITSDLGNAQKMEAMGFVLMDTLVYYGFDFGRRSIPDDVPRAHVRGFLPGDEVQVERVSTEAFKGYYGHYHADPRLERGKCDEAYVSWAVRSCSLKQVASEVLVAEHDSRILGFATLRMNTPEEGEGVLFAVAPEAQGMGIYRSFIIDGMKWCKERGFTRMVVSTQVTNVAVQKVWCRVGFEPARSFYTFHKWFTDGGLNGADSERKE